MSLAQVLNGLFLHPDRKRAMSCPIGVVPAGSDNALVWSVLGVKTATDAALLIVKVRKIFQARWPRIASA